MTFVERRTRCIVSWRVVPTRDGTVVQAMVHESVPAQRYFSDGLDVYQTALYWPAVHYPMDDKRETFPWRATTPSCATIGLAWAVAPAASLDAYAP